MADISEWSPVDESNNLPPPNGWPEGMAPSGVNNSARAVMGAVRRNYDQIINGTLELPYLKLSGGTVSGNITAQKLIVTGGYFIQAAGLDRLLAGYDSGYFVIYDTAGQPAISLAPTGSYYRNGSHTFQDEAGTNLTTITAGGTITATQGNFSAGVNAAANIIAGGTVQASQLTSTGNITATSVVASGSIQGAYISSTGSIQAANDIDAVDTVSAGTITSRGGILATGGIGGSAVSSSGSITATLDVTAGRNMATTSIYASATVQGNYLYSTNLMRADGSLTTGFDITAGRDIASTRDMTCGATFTSTAGYSNINAIQPVTDHNGFVGRAGLSFDSMSCYNYITVSDARLKRDIEEPEGCLDLVRKVPPRTYRWADRSDQRQHWGLLAQDFGDFPGRLIDPETGQERLALNQLLTLLWGAVRELTARLEAMEEAHAR